MSIASARKEFEAQVEELFSNASARTMSSHSQLSVCSRQRSDSSLCSFQDLSTEENRTVGHLSPDNHELGNVRRLKKLYEDKLRKQEKDYACWLNSKDHEILQLQREVTHLNDLLSNASAQNSEAREPDEECDTCRQFEETENELELSNARIKLMEEEIQRLRMNEDDAKARIEELREKLVRSEDERDSAVAAAKELKVTCLELECSLEVVREEGSSQRQTIFEQTSELNRLRSMEKEYLTLCEEYESLKKSKDELELSQKLIQLTEFPEHRVKLELDLNDKLVTTQMYQTSANAAESEKDSGENLSQDSFEQETNTSDEESDQCDMEKHVESLQESLELKNMQITKLEEELGSKKQNEDSEIRILQQKHNEALEQLQTDNKLLEDRLNEISQMKLKNEQLSLEIANLQDQCNHLTEKEKTRSSTKESFGKPSENDISEHLKRAVYECNWRQNNNNGAKQYPHLYHFYPSGVPGADNATQSDPDLDAVYIRSVMFKFLTNTDPYVNRQLTTIISGMLKLSGEEERLMHRSLKAKGWSY